MFKRAYHDTLRQAGGLAGLTLLIGGPIVSWVSLGYFADAAEMDSAWPQFLAGLAGFGAVALLMFLLISPLRRFAWSGTWLTAWLPS